MSTPIADRWQEAGYIEELGVASTATYAGFQVEDDEPHVPAGYGRSGWIKFRPAIQAWVKITTAGVAKVDVWRLVDGVWESKLYDASNRVFLGGEGATYWIRVLDDLATTPSGSDTYSVSVSLTGTPSAFGAPATYYGLPGGNDHASAVTIHAGEQQGGTVTGLASADPAYLVGIEGLSGYKAMWWKFTPTVTGLYQVGTSSSSLLAIFQGSAPLRATDQSAGFTIELTAGIEYRIKVARSSGFALLSLSNACSSGRYQAVWAPATNFNMAAGSALGSLDATTATLYPYRASNQPNVKALNLTLSDPAPPAGYLSILDFDFQVRARHTAPPSPDANNDGPAINFADQAGSGRVMAGNEWGWQTGSDVVRKTRLRSQVSDSMILNSSSLTLWSAPGGGINWYGGQGFLYWQNGTLGDTAVITLADVGTTTYFYVLPDVADPPDPAPSIVGQVDATRRVFAD